MSENYFKQLYDIDVRDKTKQKNSLSYLSWATAWAEVKKVFPDSYYTIYKQEIKITETKDGTIMEKTVLRPWFDDGNTGWVRTGVTINGLEHIEELPIMDFKNKSMLAESITSSDANKSIQRSLTKACARHGLGLYIYEGEDLPEEAKEILNLQNEILAVMTKKCAISDAVKEKVGVISKEILADENGDPKLCEDLETLKTLKKKLLAIRK